MLKQCKTRFKKFFRNRYFCKKKKSRSNVIATRHVTIIIRYGFFFAYMLSKISWNSRWVSSRAKKKVVSLMKLSLWTYLLSRIMSLTHSKLSFRIQLTCCQNNEVQFFIEDCLKYDNFFFFFVSRSLTYTKTLTRFYAHYEWSRLSFISTAV